MPEGHREPKVAPLTKGNLTTGFFLLNEAKKQALVARRGGGCSDPV